MAIKQFQKGAAVYVCRSCGKRTRAVGDEINSVSVKGDQGLCADCWDLAGYDNARQDNCLEAASFPYVVGIFEYLAKNSPKSAAPYFPRARAGGRVQRLIQQSASGRRASPDQ